MEKIDWARKLSSRKFWAAVSGVVISVMIMFGASSSEQERVAGVISSAGILACYILAEGAADKAAINNPDEDNSSDVK